MAKVAVIGLGNMGGPIARNILRAGHDLTVFDIDTARQKVLVAAGAKAATSPAEAAGSVEFVFTLVPRGTTHRALYFGPDGLLAAARPGMLLIDSATSEIALAREIAEAAAARQCEAVDAPISGGVAGAEAGSLTFMVGGSEAAVARLRPILAGTARTVIHVGGPGTGQAAKICNNMMVGAITVATCEGFLLAETLGLDAAKLFEVASVSSARSWVLENLCPVPGVVPNAPSSNGYKPGGASALLLKDLLLAMEEAQGEKLSVPMTGLATSLYAMFCAGGNGDVDSSGLIRMLRGS
jgi:3-hydroxyisobutyrate dehydrogenase